MNLILKIKDWWRGVPTLGGRSGQWPKTRKAFLLKHQNCEVCGTNKKISVHHKKPFHLFPELENEWSNLISLCEKNNCHLRFGHLYSFLSYNPEIEEDAKLWYIKIKTRPYEK